MSRGVVGKALENFLELLYAEVTVVTERGLIESKERRSPLRGQRAC